MAFDREPAGYEKTALSDLQGAWQSLRDMVVAHAGFSGWERALLHIDEGYEMGVGQEPPVYA